MAVREDGDQRLLRSLRALAVPNHLPLLRLLQVPRTVAEIRLMAARPSSHLTPDRPVSRQAVAAHLRTLTGLGLVLTRRGTRQGRAATTYVVNHARMFALTDDLRRLALLRPVGDAAERTAIPSSEDGSMGPRLPDGPCLLLGYGPVEAAAFPLRGPGPWSIGRAETAAVALPHDPFVSQEHARLSMAQGRLRLEPLAARNGTWHNWRRLAAGEQVALRGGDAIGVGRSLLFVREA